MIRLALLLFLCGSASSTLLSSRSKERPIQILNDGSNRIDIYWVNPDTREEIMMSEDGIIPGTEFSLNSYVGHQFTAKEKPRKSGDCKNEDKVCRQVYFAVSENDDQLIRITKEFTVDFVDNKIKARNEASQLLNACQAGAKERLEKAGEKKAEAVAAIDELVKCVEQGVAGTLERVNDEIAFQASVRRSIAAQLENYTCIDDTLNSTDDVATKSWFHEGKFRQVHIKHERPASRIHVVENFIDEEECIAMEEAAKASLHRATVADGKGGSRLSESRKAMQAGIIVNWSKENDGDAIARLSRRVYEYTNYVLGLDIKEHGQEDLMSIQYFGRGKDDAEPDRYTPHCDGDCTGLPHKFGQRMATMVMYCTIADRGGHTNFRNAGVHIKPEKGNAIFFSYIDPETMLMDTGFTEHSGCPVYEGSKKIVTQWIRLGVDHDNTWDSFNTLGVKLSEAQAYMALEDEDFGSSEEQEEGGTLNDDE